MLDAGFWLGFALVYAATLLLNHFHLLGLSQAYRSYVTQVPDATSNRLQVHGPYGLVRHPLMTGLLLCSWSASTFTVGHLLWAVGMTGYVVLGTVLEERDLIARFGAPYRHYATEVPAFFPVTAQHLCPHPYPAVTIVPMRPAPFTGVSIASFEADSLGSPRTAQQPISQ